MLSRDEHDADGPVEAKVVEEVFVREGLLTNLTVNGRVIRTTFEHPFFVWNRGWVPCGELQVGDRIATESGAWVAVEGVEHTGVWAPVYNIRVADYHTYFVGTDDWGFSVWAHNADYHAVEELVRQGIPTHEAQEIVSRFFASGLSAEGELALRAELGNRTRPQEGAWTPAHVDDLIWAARMTEEQRIAFNQQNVNEYFANPGNDPHTLQIAAGQHVLHGALPEDIALYGRTTKLLVQPGEALLPFVGENRFKRVVSIEPYDPTNVLTPTSLLELSAPVLSPGGEFIVAGNRNNTILKAIGRMSNESLAPLGFERITPPPSGSRGQVSSGREQALPAIRDLSSRFTDGGQVYTLTNAVQVRLRRLG